MPSQMTIVIENVLSLFQSLVNDKEKVFFVSNHTYSSFIYERKEENKTILK